MEVDAAKALIGTNESYVAAARIGGRSAGRRDVFRRTLE
jgi:phage gpG-like protein